MDLDGLRKEVGANIREARLNAGYKSQRKLAQKLSFSHTKLSEIERGECTASYSDLQEISIVLKVAVETLLALDPNQKLLMREYDDFISVGDYIGAKNTAIELIRSSKNEDYRLRNYNALGKVLLLSGKHQKALSCWLASEKCTTFSKQENADKFRVFYNQALCFYNLSQYSQALNAIEKSLKLASVEEGLTVRSHHLQANIFAETNQLDKALAKLKIALSYYEISRMTDLVIRTKNSIADIFHKRGQHKIAMRLFDESRTLALKASNTDGICKASFEMVQIIYDTNRELVEGTDILNEVEVFTINSRTPIQTARLLYWRSKCEQSERGNSVLLEKAFELLRETDEFELLHQVCYMLGEHFERIGDTTEAMKYYKNASKQLRKQKGGGGRHEEDFSNVSIDGDGFHGSARKTG